MPAWDSGGDFGVKLATIAPTNAAANRPTINGVYILFDGTSGEPRCVLDAAALTVRRTAAASALACDVLSKPNARSMLMIGTGRLARQLILAHCAVRPINEVRIWGRTPARASDVAEEICRKTDINCFCVADVEIGAKDADIISSATFASSPVLRGEWVSSGTHIDLVGAFKPTMCEADVNLIGKADQVFVDTFDGARHEAGELIQAAEIGKFSFDDIAGDLHDIARAGESLRIASNAITIYKSVGMSLQDLAAAKLCVKKFPRLKT